MFSAVFSNLLTSRDVSGYKLKHDTGIPESLTSNYKAGKVQPSIENLIKLADYFGVTVDYLLERETGESATQASVQGSNIVQGDNNSQITQINGEARPLSDQEAEILRLFAELDTVKRAKVLIYAADLISGIVCKDGCP